MELMWVNCQLNIIRKSFYKYNEHRTIPNVDIVQ